MLQTIRDKSQGIFAIVIAGILCLTFAFWGIRNYLDSSNANRSIAAVNGTKISQQNFTTEFERYRMNQVRVNPSLALNQQAIMQMKQQFLTSMVNTLLLTQSADKNGFAISHDLLAFELAHIPAFQVKGHFSEQRFQIFLSNMMYTPDAFFKKLSDSMVLSQIRSAFVLTSFALPQEGKTLAQLVHQQRAYDYLVIPYQRFLKNVDITSKEISDYYQANPDLFSVPATVSLAYLELSLKQIKKDIHPTQAALKTYYQNNMNHYTIPKQWHIDHISIPVDAHASSAVVEKAQQKANDYLARLHAGKSIRQITKNNTDLGGVMPWLTLLKLNQNWQLHVLQLKKPGDVVGPFRTSNGFEIIQLLGVKPAVVKPYSEVAHNVRADYIEQHAEQQFSSMSDRLGVLTFEHPNSLQLAAKTLKLPIKKTEVFTNQGGTTSLTRNPKVIKAAFSNNVFHTGDNSDVIQLSDTDIVVIRADKKHLERTKPLSEVRSSIRKTLSEKQASASAEQLATQIMQKILQGISLQQLAQKHRLKINHQPLTKRHNDMKGNQAAALHAAFESGVPAKNTPAVNVFPLGNGDWGLFNITQVKSVLPKTKNKVYQMGLSRSLGMLEYLLYVQGLHHSAKIKVHKLASLSS